MEDEEICRAVYEKIGDVEEVVDIGCGDGFLVNCLASKLDEQVLGCDISNEGFDKAHSRCEEFETCGSIDCVKIDAHRLLDTFSKDTFDVTTFIYSLHHMDRPVDVLEQARKVLKDQGKLVIGDFWFTERKEKGGCYRFTPGEIKNMIKEAGLKYLGQDRIGKEFTILIGEK
ncbi:MAG: class I SAM-dependent methyltransferase [Candidatus Natronoplasma sp.]